MKNKRVSKTRLVRCAVDGCLTFIGSRCNKYCAEHSAQAWRHRPSGGPKKPTGGKKPGTHPNPIKQVGNNAKIHEVGLMDSFGERQILRSIFGGG